MAKHFLFFGSYARDYNYARSSLSSLFLISFIPKHDAYRLYSQDKKKAPAKKTKFF